MRLLIAAFLLLLGLSLAPSLVTAEEAPPTAPVVKIDKRKLLVQRKGADGSAAQTSFFEDPVLWARDLQQAFYGQLSGALRQVKTGTAAAATWSLVLLSFGYGVFHAAGPGHGKVVISAWLLATENELRRGILISFLSAIIQALSAIVLVSVLFLVVASVGTTARSAAGLLESASYAMIGFLGLFLFWTGIRALLPAKAALTPVVQTQSTSFNLHRFDTFEPMDSPAAASAPR